MAANKDNTLLNRRWELYSASLFEKIYWFELFSIYMNEVPRCNLSAAEITPVCISLQDEFRCVCILRVINVNWDEGLF